VSEELIALGIIIHFIQTTVPLPAVTLEYNRFGLDINYHVILEVFNFIDFNFPILNYDRLHQCWTNVYMVNFKTLANQGVQDLY
jgi:hypothetical protein